MGNGLAKEKDYQIVVEIEGESGVVAEIDVSAALLKNKACELKGVVGSFRPRA